MSYRGFVLINGKKANIVRRICMNQIMVDENDIDDAKIGTKVVLLDKS